MENIWKEKIAIALIGLLFISSSLLKAEAVESKTSNEHEGTDGSSPKEQFISDAAMLKDNLQNPHYDTETMDGGTNTKRKLLGKFLSYDIMKKNRGTGRKLLNKFISYDVIKKNNANGRHMLNKFISNDAMKKNGAFPIGRKLLNKFIGYPVLKKNRAFPTGRKLLIKKKTLSHWLEAFETSLEAVYGNGGMKKNRAFPIGRRLSN